MRVIRWCLEDGYQSKEIDFSEIEKMGQFEEVNQNVLKVNILKK